MNGLNEFERSVKDALEPYEVPYNSADWAQLERTLDQGDNSGRVSRSGLYALLFGGALAASSSLFVLVAPVSGDTEASGLASVPSGIVVEAARTGANMEVENQGAPIIKRNEQVSVAEVGTEHTKGAPGISGVAVASEPKPSEVVPVPNKTITKESGNTSTGPAVRASVTEGCPGTSIDFAAENLPEKGIYLWNFGDGSFSNKPTPSHSFSKSGSFEVMLSHSSPGGGNIHNKPAADQIIIHEAPEASFNLLKQEYDNTVPSVHFENRSLGGQKYAWDFGDGATSEIAHPDHVYKKSGVYNVSLIVTNANGCVDHAERTVRIDNDYDLLSPKTFSPNADGVDDVFMPEALKTLGVKFHLSIFDSNTGELVYETSDAQRPWNGRLTNRGDQCIPGDYVWMVEMKDGEKLGGTYNGSVNLVR